jgi:hypothetical protein
MQYPQSHSENTRGLHTSISFCRRTSTALMHAHLIFTLLCQASISAVKSPYNPFTAAQHRPASNQTLLHPLTSCCVCLGTTGVKVT